MNEQELQEQIDSLETELRLLRLKEKKSKVSIKGEILRVTDFDKIGGDYFYSPDKYKSKSKTWQGYKRMVPVVIVEEVDE